MMTKTGAPPCQAPALSRRGVLILGLAALITGVAAGPAEAQRFRRRMRRMRRRAVRRLRRRGGGLPERARGAIRRGEIRPLRDVIQRVRQRSNSEILDVDLHQNANRWIYALRVLTPNGRVRDVFIDGRTLEVLNHQDTLGGDGVPLPPELLPADPLGDAPPLRPPPAGPIPPAGHRPPPRSTIPPPVRRPR